MITILSGLIGAVSGITQNIIEKKQERKAEGEKYEKLLQLEEVRLKRSEVEIGGRSNIAEATTFNSFANAVIKTGAPLSGKYKSERIANFVVALTRPVITLVLLAMAFLISLKYGFENKTFVLEATFSTLDYTLAYWFIRRSFEKRSGI